MTSAVVLKDKADSKWLYSGVKLTIHNIIIPEERLSPTPSLLDGMDLEMEVELRIVGCELIQDSGVLLKLPQVAMATAQVLYQRFFHSKSFVRHFYELIICYLQALGQETNQSLVQTAWNLMNDSLRTDLFVRYLPEAIACACIYLASCKLGVPLPRHPAWWEMFTVDDESVHEIALCLMRLYARPRSNVTDLEYRLGKLRKSLVETKEREFALRKQTESSTPGAASEQSSDPASPPQNGVAKQNADPQRGSDMADVKGNDLSGVLNSQSLLANALATAKAVAATITASKTSQLDSDVDMNNLPTSSVTIDAKDIQPSNGRRGAVETSPDFDQKCSEQQASLRRPSAYPPVAPAAVEENLDSTLSRKRKLTVNQQQVLSRIPRSTHPGDSDSPPADSTVYAGPPSAYSLVNISRHYRHRHTKNASSISSGSSASPSPTRKKYNGVVYDSSNKISRDRSSSSNTSSSHSDYHGSSRNRSTTDSRKYKRNQEEERNGPQPPKAYRTDNRSSREESSSKQNRSNGGGSKSKSSRSHTRHRHHRSRDTKDIDDKRKVNSRERRRR